MKKIFLILFLLFTVQTFAADWDLFPRGQRSYFSYPEDTLMKVEVYAMDSVVGNGIDDILYFRKKLPFTAPSSCNLDSIRLAQWDGVPEFLIDSLVKKSDTVFYYSALCTLPFYFITSATVGQSWTITSDYTGNDYNQITISCDSLILETFIGVTDSVKVFSMTANGVSSGQPPIDNYKMKLSKNYGLIEFVPLSRFIVHPYYKLFFEMKLIGVESDSIQAYYKQPSFSDYFDLSPGDILFWDYDVYFFQAPFPYGYHENYRDSITDVAVYPDSVIYTYDRMIEDTDMVITSYFNRRMYFVRSMLEPLVETAPDWYAYGNIENLNWGGILSNWNQYWFADTMTISIDSVNNDTTTAFTLHTYGASLNLLNCNYTETFDYFNGITVDSKRGLTSIIVGPESMTLTGSRINGVQNGNITLNIKDQVTKIAEFKIVPNPATGFCTLYSAIELIDSDYFIYNYSGQLVAKDKYDGKGINISGLTSGIYIFKIKTSSGNIESKLSVY